MRIIKPAYWVVIHAQTHARLCQDGKLREFACFGTFPECVKIYRREGNAMNAADKYLDYEGWEIRGVHEGERMDAAGNVFDKEGNRRLHRSLNTSFPHLRKHST